MANVRYNPFTPSRRFIETADFSEITKSKPEKSLLGKKHKTGGRNHFGRNTNINIGGGHKRRYRIVDFKRDKRDVLASVIAIEYDPNRTTRLALLRYVDGERRYILCPEGLRVGDRLQSGENAEVRIGNALPLKNIPVGQSVHNIELKIGRGGQIVRSAGGSAQIAAKEGEYALLKLPSGEMRKVLVGCYATIGVLGNAEHINMAIGKAGRSRWLGIRPHNRGVSKNPVDHPMGGGQGKTSGGRHPCSRTGVLAKGLKTRTNKRTNKFILKRRAKGKAR
ncbi:MAG TPA: 50S ribosomal protein L2 [Oligoflexia bacterium]|nr:50S ribosomal protein L2 [Oligoflexia bacterium]HMP26495.1 50S ribosomal protein L2 [Oligoflexia bacterium]